MIKAVLFDLDGTLIDTNELIYNSFVKTFKDKLEMELTREEIVDFFGRPLGEPFKKYSKRDNVDDLVAYYREYNEAIHDTMCFAFDGVKELLDGLKERNIKIGIVTSKRAELAIRGMKVAGIYDYMDIIITPESTELHKPNPDPCLKACSDLGIESNEAMMVGDSIYDIYCGKSAGCKTCGVNYTFIGLDTLKSSEPDYLIDKPEDILNLI
ncbi:pyrophosphatase PpaX [Clostridium nigeriense]|uniref:pyrophosphatase PpaX n=1 Tax=Clostridium nigeriense TaxID=1805470 RepID=UPI0008347600|nr:pyrophosphatase PpaX [Clostridium nigeriense]